jgi:tetratricopeptide (TPR) repeat protein
VCSSDLDKGIISSNLKNASRIADKYITDTLEKPSRVVEGWIDALFMQNVVLKSDPTQINEKFQMNFPNQPKAAAQTQTTQTTTETAAQEETTTTAQEEEQIQGTGFVPSSAYYQNANSTLLETINRARSTQNPEDALSLYDEALEIAQNSGAISFVAAIHYEKGKIYDDYEHVDSALSEYSEATVQTPDDNLRSLAHLKMAKIYDDYVKYEPAVEHYHSAIAYSGEANNIKGQTTAVKNLSGMFADRYDVENTLTFSELTVDCAQECDTTTEATAYSFVAKNYESIGENHKALEYYGKSVQIYGEDEESLWQVAQNYLDASNLMRKLGNDTKADSLLSKHLLYLDKAQQS